MSAQPTTPVTPPDHVNIEIDGKPMTVPKGAMIIQAADKAGIPIPRFCYHDRLPIAANCRMCLVDVEKAPKPMPACATPVMEGMKVYTQSKRALDSQRNVMEFLLINHPLDCPICDQGGECELQDVAMGYGRSVSRFAERKRVVPDENLGSLVATDMTRCIQCTRCVRFTAEIAGTHELGGMNRGEHLEIGTYIGKAMESELSGNVIDVCPVGALTNKVYRFRARPWELIARESLGYHDAIGSNLFLHARRGEVMRTVPRDNDAVNECWLSDRDRYSHQGLYADDRLQRPMIRKGDKLVETSWDEAIAFVAAGLRQAGSSTAALVHPMTTSEEGYLLASIVRGLGSDSIDHRLRTTDFGDAAAGAVFEMPLAQIEQAKDIFIVGSNPRYDQPLLGHRIRKAWKKGARIHVVNPVAFDFHFEAKTTRVVGAGEMVGAINELANGDVATAAREGANAVVIFGDYAVQHPQASALRAAAKALATAVGGKFNEIASGPNAVGLTRVGVVPASNGRDAGAILAESDGALVVYNAYAPDFADAQALAAAKAKSTFNVFIGAFAGEGASDNVHAMLPIALLPETDGTLVNVDGLAQRARAGGKLLGEIRDGWRVLRALGASLGVAGFEFTELAEARAKMAPLLEATTARANGRASSGDVSAALARHRALPPYEVDAVVRRSPALQETPIAVATRAGEA